VATIAFIQSFIRSHQSGFKAPRLMISVVDRDTTDHGMTLQHQTVKKANQHTHTKS
jgi:hypothetical protein